MAKSAFFENPDFPTLVVSCKATKQQKFCPDEPGVARVSFFLFFLSLLILLILLIEFNFVLTFLKDARERGAHEDCQSPLPGQVPGPVSQGRCAIMRTIRTRTNDELDGGSK